MYPGDGPQQTNGFEVVGVVGLRAERQEGGETMDRFSRYEKEELRMDQEEAEELGITLTELLLFKVLMKLDNLSVTTYDGDNI